MVKKIFLCFVAAILLAAFGGYLFVTNYGEPGSGISKTVTRELESFDRISLEEFGTLNVSIGDVQQVTITTDDNLVDLVNTTVDNGRLKIRPIKAINPGIDLVINVTVSNLSAVDVAGSVRLNLVDVNTESLDIELAGACGANGSGHVENFSLEMAGACRANLKSLETKNAVVELAGMGSATVFATESIDAEASGLGKITCHGNPQDVKKEANGISRVTIVGG